MPSRLHPLNHQRNRQTAAGLTPLNHPVRLPGTQHDRLARLPEHARGERRDGELCAVFVEEEMRNGRRYGREASR